MLRNPYFRTVTNFDEVEKIVNGLNQTRNQIQNKVIQDKIGTTDILQEAELNLTPLLNQHDIHMKVNTLNKQELKRLGQLIDKDDIKLRNLSKMDLSNLLDKAIREAKIAPTKKIKIDRESIEELASLLQSTDKSPEDILDGSFLQFEESILDDLPDVNIVDEIEEDADEGTSKGKEKSDDIVINPKLVSNGGLKKSLFTVGNKQQIGKSGLIKGTENKLEVINASDNRKIMFENPSKGLLDLLYREYPYFKGHQPLVSDKLKHIKSEDYQDYANILNFVEVPTYKKGAKKPKKASVYDYSRSLIAGSENVSGNPIKDTKLDKIKTRGFGLKHGYKLTQGGGFGKLSIDLDDLFNHLTLTAKKGGKVVMNKKVDIDLVDLLSKRYNPRKKYSKSAISDFRKLVKLSELPVHRGTGKFKFLQQKHVRPDLFSKKNVTQGGVIPILNGDQVINDLFVKVGNLLAGNNNPQTRNECMILLDSALNMGVITPSQHSKIFSNISSI
jgi:hypothetical protein